MTMTGITRLATYDGQLMKNNTPVVARGKSDAFTDRRLVVVRKVVQVIYAHMVVVQIDAKRVRINRL